ncbi:MAG: DNA polymerase sliding clamp [Candidatus Methanoperedens nitroreducens]|uniref:DNA polymerase sliding clamp n=1 Tax=Candidatus Methanoperedens nitratireducens TaxID=1392998 RepID=A0A0P7ZCG3_9EURY|nr:DNA polymerase sliding clamp [Candidatus Methanoperedens sp. BLZ2]KAB2946648.1 MAG: DNA polymerase sliding clamp [Candidatus Methanoperedens sp.]KPQ41149.1 MAG: DNA polymerase sliding clamp [Candidatus Methanoperedens sp. BLZ1]MBZ0173985.1 DNA polymerase sliding clamp [Candidatus Methanoperedens nitroreducens]MCX9078912.1 DNA polymerase sliding clamp [Candidatus Methanoperedens sp.]
MFKALIGAEKLKDSIESISTLVDEARFRLTSQGLSVKAVDPANVAMVSFELSKDAFESFDATEGELGIDLTKLIGVMEMAEKSDNIELELDEASHKLIVRMRGLAYTMSLLDPSSIRKEPKVPSLDLPAHIVIRGEDIKRAVKAAEKVSDYMSMGVKGDVFFMEAEGDTDKVHVELGKSQLIDLQGTDAKSLFSLDYLSDMSKILGKSNEVNIDLGKDFPLKIRIKIAEGHGEVSYMLAPRVESE